MAHDGFSLDDKRTPVTENDIPDVIQCWKNRLNADASTSLGTSFETARAKRISDLRRELAPLKTERLTLHAEINRLQFESAIATPTPTALAGTSPKSDMETSHDNQTSTVGFGRGRVGVALSEAQARLAELESKIAAPQSELDRLTRQFWVDVAQVRANKYDLSTSRYRQADADETYHESPQVTLERLSRLEEVMASEIDELKKIVGKE